MIEKKQEHRRRQPTPRQRLSPRDASFKQRAAAGALGIAAVGSMIVTYGYLSPNVLFEPPTTFEPEAPIYIRRTQSLFSKTNRCMSSRQENGFYAVSAVCTHLGCVTQWKPELGLIACPCHGSKFKPDGAKIEGPAPRPLPHFAISLTADGLLQVDKLEIVSPGQALKA